MNLTPRCRLALNYAKESLSRFGHSHVSSAHLVLGVLALRGGVAHNFLRQAGLSVDSVAGYLSLRHTSEEESAIYDGAPLGRSALLAFQRAEAESRARQLTYLGVEHLLLGILAEHNGEAADLFASVHVDRQQIKRTAEQEINND